MVKWIWKLYTQKESLWGRPLHAKYMRNGDIFKARGGQGSQFWKSLHKIKHLFKWGAIQKVGDGRLAQFWNDVWLKFVPLRVCFPRLPEICDNKEGSVPEYAARGGTLV
jgi:hypothetical protein